jgi:hypothetical protein
VGRLNLDSPEELAGKEGGSLNPRDVKGGGSGSVGRAAGAGLASTEGKGGTRFEDGEVFQESAEGVSTAQVGDEGGEGYPEAAAGDRPGGAGGARRLHSYYVLFY